MTTFTKIPTLLLTLGVAACATSMTTAGSTTDPSASSPGGGDQTPVAQTASAAQPSTMASLSFSDEQADRGRNVFRTSCTECHYTSEFSDRQFKFKWRRRSAGDLYGHMMSTMPEDAPASLEPQAYADLVAYILRMNGVEPGAGELPPDEIRLDALSLTVIGN